VLAIILGVGVLVFILIAIGMLVRSRYKKKRVMQVQEKAMEAANTGGGASNIDDDKVASAGSFPEDSSYGKGRNPI
jgi:hypothetical protein